ncbi:MAG: lysozyme [Sphingomonadales bacterium]|jgi:GH24 family phage-related lysozyme (muramidase)|nr:lysozyme [Sphingomonadales bacterium]
MAERNLPAFPAAPRGAPGKKTLAGVIGTLAGAVLLFTVVPREESGRTVKATAEASGDVHTRHVAGKQYLRAYKDIVGVVTICDGDTHDVRMGQTATEAECDARLERQLIAHAEPLIRCARPLYGKPNQVAASVSLAYNIGPAGFCRGSVARKINAGDWSGASAAFLLYNRAGGRVNRGLDGRRHREQALFDTDRPPQGAR